MVQINKEYNECRAFPFLIEAVTKFLHGYERTGVIGDRTDVVLEDMDGQRVYGALTSVMCITISWMQIFDISIVKLH